MEVNIKNSKNNKSENNDHNKEILKKIVISGKQNQKQHNRRIFNGNDVMFSGSAWSTVKHELISYPDMT